MGPLTCRGQNNERDVYRKMRERERELGIKKKTWHSMSSIKGSYPQHCSISIVMMTKSTWILILFMKYELAIV